MVETRRNTSLASLGQALALVAVAAVGWYLWSQVRDLGPEPEPVLREPSNDHIERMQSLEALISRGPDAVPELLERLSSDDPRGRRDAVMALGRIGPDAIDALGVVRDCLRDEDATVRQGALTAFSRITSDPDETVAIAAAMLSDSDSGARNVARDLLIRAGPRAVPALTPLLKSDSPAARLKALEVLEFGYKSAEVVEAVRGLLADSDTGVRRQATGLIGRSRSFLPSEPRVWMRDVDSQIRVHGIWAIDWHLPDAVDALPDLLSCIDLKDRNGSPLILSCLQALKTAARPAIPILLELVDSPDLQNESALQSRIAIIETLDKIGAPSEDLARLAAQLVLNPVVGGRACAVLVRSAPDEARQQVSRLTAQLLGDGPALKPDILRTLGVFGAQAREAVPVLVPLLSSDDAEFRMLVASTVAKIDPQAAAPAVPFLIASIDLNQLDPYENVPPPAIDVLAEIGPPARDAVPKLLEALERSNVEKPKTSETNRRYNSLQAKLLRALGRIDVNNPTVVDALQRHLTNDDGDTYFEGADALASADLTVAGVRAGLDRIRHDRNPHVRVIAVWAIARRSGDPENAVAELLNEFEDEDPNIRAAAAIGLGKMGTAAAAAADRLRGALDDILGAGPGTSSGDRLASYVYVREENWDCHSISAAISWALARIDPDSSASARQAPAKDAVDHEAP
jgi:HEAT repeat protein